MWRYFKYESAALQTSHVITPAMLHVCIDYIVMWNFAHMVGPSAKAQLSKHIEKLGYKPPLIATPEGILEELP